MSAGRNKTYNTTQPLWGTRVVAHLAKLLGTSDANVIRVIVCDYLVSLVIRDDFNPTRLLHAVTAYGATRGRQTKENEQTEQSFLELAEAFLNEDPLPHVKPVEAFAQSALAPAEPAGNVLILRDRVERQGKALSIVTAALKSRDDFESFKKQVMGELEDLMKEDLIPVEPETMPKIEDEPNGDGTPCPGCESTKTKVEDFEGGDDGEKCLSCKDCQKEFDWPLNFDDDDDDETEETTPEEDYVVNDEDEDEDEDDSDDGLF